MKKILALVLAAVMLLGVCSAFAETDAKTMVKYDEKLSFAIAVPAGYTFDYMVEEGIMLATMLPGDETMVNYLIVIAQDQEHEDLPRLNDLDEEAKAQFASELMGDLNNPTYSIQTTGHGTEVVVIEAEDAGYDVATLTTLYYGCLITMYVGHNDGATVTEAELAQAMQFMTELDFVVAE